MENIFIKLRLIAYSVRQILVGTILLLFFAINACAAEDTQTKYPPYPDIWDLEATIPTPKSFDDYFQLSISPQSNGEIWIDSFVDNKSESVRFFGRENKNKKSDNIIQSKPHQFIPSSDTKLPNGKLIIPYTRSNYCELFNDNLAILGPDGKYPALASKAIVVLLDRPIRISKHTCVAEGNKIKSGGFFTSILLFSPNPQSVMPLSDNTFLVGDYHTGLVLRFDDQLNSHSSLVGKKVFLIDRAEFDHFSIGFYKKWVASGGNEKDVNSEQALLKALRYWVLDNPQKFGGR